MWDESQRIDLARISQADVLNAMQAARRYMDRRYHEMLKSRPGGNNGWEFDVFIGLGVFTFKGRQVQTAVTERQLQQVIAGLEREASAASSSRQLSSGAWALIMLGIIKTAGLVAAAFAYGGWVNVTGDVLEQVEEQTRSEVEYLDNYVDVVVTGRQPRDGRHVRRAILYAGAAWGLYCAMRGRVATARGYNEERNLLDPGAEHCTACVAETAKGWVPRGTLKSIGGRTCRNNDRCIIVYRNARGEVVA